jgi:phenylalanyl-tRNA synthetase alpha chain
MKELGFSIQVGPQIETEYYNFELLNFPVDHPAKDMQDTFYIEPGVLLRTHTSPVQGRIMERAIPPIRIACPGRVFRNEDVSARSHAFFHQVEALYIDKDVSMQDLFWTFREFVRRLFGRQDLQVRFRPSYFPFVEPGTECDATCLICNGNGCLLCKGSGWLEICGAGMVHPQVLRNVGIDPEKYQGYAWGLGVERLVMLRRSIKDIRLFSENDLRFLRQFHAV